MFFFNAVKYRSEENLEKDFNEWRVRNRILVVVLITPESDLSKQILNESYLNSFAGHSASKVDVFFNENRSASFVELTDGISKIISESDVRKVNGNEAIIGSTVIVIWPDVAKMYCITRLDEHPPERTRQLLGVIAEYADKASLELHLDYFRLRNCFSASANYGAEVPGLLLEVLRKYVLKTDSKSKSVPLPDSSASSEAAYCSDLPQKPDPKQIEFYNNYKNTDIKKSEV